MTRGNAMNPNFPPPSQRAAYSDLFEKMLDPVFLLDEASYRLVDVNRSGERLLGKTKEEALGMNLVAHLNSDTDFEKFLRIAKRRYHPVKCSTRWKSSGSELRLDIVLCTIGLPSEERVIQVIARDVTAMEEARAREKLYLEKLEALSSTDELTQIANVRHFKVDLVRAHKHAVRYNTPYAILFCDVDHFKHFNDRNGHPAGDQVLKGVARVISSCCRGADMPARYGGEEFVVLCPGVDSSSAKVLAERIRSGIEAQPFEFGEFQPLGHVTLSIGVAAFPKSGKTETDVLASADQALYQSKKGGRNRVTVHQ